MFQYHLPKPFQRLGKDEKEKQKADYLAQWEKEAKEYGDAYHVTLSDGYKRAHAHFEELINARIRSGTLEKEWLNGVELVFGYFEGAQAKMEEAKQKLAEYKDEPE